jgi:uncharacterized tellurite resistance protein B-like protein
MIERIRAFFRDQILAAEPTAVPADALRRATAALLVEVMVTDRLVDDAEAHRIRELLARHFQLTDTQAAELLELARQEAAEATSLYPFTALVNEHFSPLDKYELIHNLWEVAYADGSLDKHEEALIRHIAELIHLPHAGFVKARNQVRDRRRAEAAPGHHRDP